MSIVLQGSTSGSITLQEPAVAGSNTLNLPAVTGTVVVAGKNSAITADTAKASTSGTSIDFTGIPSWVKRVTVMFSEVTTNGGSNLLVQLGTSSGFEITNYISTSGTVVNTGVDATSATSGFNMRKNDNQTLQFFSGHMVITNITSNSWVSSHNGKTNTARWIGGGGSKTLAATFDRLRITTVNGTDAFNGGTINILYE